MDEITEEQANKGISMLTGYNTRVPFSDFWKHFNQSQKRKYDKIERALNRLSFTKKMELLEKVNDLIEEYSQKKKKGVENEESHDEAERRID